MSLKPKTKTRSPSVSWSNAETLMDLINMHVERGLDFILARVCTVDPNDDAKFYYSYYAAHHINKALFRTEPELGLLHRMRARNVPTSNASR
jgi:Domain of unknown function (DUF5092)